MRTIRDFSGIASILSYVTRGTGVIFAKVRGAALCAAVLLVSACAASPEQPAAAPPTQQPDTPSSSLPPGQVKTSDNVKLVANVPRAAPLNGADDWNTDLAFQGDYAFVGNYDGFSIYDISDPTNPKTVSQVACPGAAERRLGLRRPAVPVGRRAAQRRLLRQSTDDGARLGGHADLRHQRQDQPEVRRRRRDRLRLAHPHAGARRSDKLYVYVSSPGPEPDSPTARRRTTASPSSRCR